MEIDRLIALAVFQGVREGIRGRRPAFSSASGNSWWNSTSERPIIIRHFSAQVCRDWGNRHLTPDSRLHNIVSCQTVVMMKLKHHQSTVRPQAGIAAPVYSFPRYEIPREFYIIYINQFDVKSKIPTNLLCNIISSFLFSQQQVGLTTFLFHYSIFIPKFLFSKLFLVFSFCFCILFVSWSTIYLLNIGNFELHIIWGVVAAKPALETILWFLSVYQHTRLCAHRFMVCIVLIGYLHCKYSTYPVRQLLALQRQLFFKFCWSGCILGNSRCCCSTDLVKKNMSSQ